MKPVLDIANFGQCFHVDWKLAGPLQVVRQQMVPVAKECVFRLRRFVEDDEAQAIIRPRSGMPP